MVSMGQIPDKFIGLEASGIILRVGNNVQNFNIGDEVSFLGHGAHSTVFRTKAAFCQLIPCGLSFAQAACLPLAHCTAYHALINKARAKKGQSILIHSAAGGVGQATIQLAQHLGLEIFATVGSPEKRKILREIYDLPDDHILYSRDLSFAKAVLRLTNGRGVDCVLNSLAGEALRQTWHCIAPFGCFIEIGCIGEQRARHGTVSARYDISNNQSRACSEGEAGTYGRNHDGDIRAISARRYEANLSNDSILRVRS
jgi:NADPH:quinone reductase-like Zn-dependent oxidoreductase